MSDDFDAARRTGIGGSDAAAVLGVSPWKTPYDLFLEKIGEAEPLPQTERMYWGTVLEPVILAEYCRRTGRQIETAPAMLRHPTHEWLIGHIDGRVIGERRIVECKTAGISIGWDKEDSENSIPQHHWLQCHHYLTLTGAEICDLVVLIGGQDFRIYQILRDPDFARGLVEKEAAFWWHVEHREPPDPINTADAVRRWGRIRSPGSVHATEAEAKVIDRLREIKKLRDDLDAEEDKGKSIIMMGLGERADTLCDLAGNTLATWRLDNGRKGYTVKAREPQRKFLLKD